MTDSRFAPFRIGVVCMVAALAVNTPTLADVLMLTDGRTLVGELISEEKKFIVYRCNIAGVWSNQ